ncbi:hypothetical protein [Chachezhania antarctica]|uniref:hypothetical protein n=1 Tax=Chachezhania antarctica TaxID=2340860 RepID=UPI000EB0A942|nr:hypothetical protein [Chachezhania antarctica]|tara:strand:- start:16792 stop:17049 length:258 start_codon:yes stop_codon:yes gene_type:complete
MSGSAPQGRLPIEISGMAPTPACICQNSVSRRYAIVRPAAADTTFNADDRAGFKVTLHPIGPAEHLLQNIWTFAPVTGQWPGDCT